MVVAMALGIAVVTTPPLVTAAEILNMPSLRPSMDASGRFQVRFQSDASLYYQLVRSSYGPSGEQLHEKIIAMRLGTGDAMTLRDPVLPDQDTFYHVVAARQSESTDADGDGVSDVSELANFPLGNPLNPAMSLPLKDGAVAISDRDTFDLLARRDNVPGAQEVREVKFLITDVDTEKPKLYLFNTRTHIFHYYFARDVLRYTRGLRIRLIDNVPSVDAMPQSGTSVINIGRVVGEGESFLHFTIFDPRGRRISNLSEEQLRHSKRSLVARLKEDLEPYWDDGSIPSPQLEEDLIFDLNIIIENFIATIFDADTYFSTARRKNLAGSLLAHDSYVAADGRSGVITMEFWPSDPVTFQFVEMAYHLISGALPFIDNQLAYHPASETQRALFEREGDQYDNSFVRSIHTRELFGNVTYTAMNLGFGFGLLRVANAGDTLSARDVVIFRSLPNDLTHVAGILTEIPQTPLSHVNLKAIQNNTPNAYVKDASTTPEVAALIGKYVRYEVTSDGFTLREASQAEVDEHLESLRPEEPQFPERDLSQTAIKDLDVLELADSNSYGAKSANLAELRKILPDEMTPSGFAVPFYFYDEFMKANGFYDQAAAMIEDETFKSDPAVREKQLEEFRKTVKDGTAPQWMLDAIQDLHDQFPEGTNLRCRSSTNNEDLENFNGAGLYESYTHRVDEGHLIKSMRQVWAGLWTYRAFEERDFYRIDHFTAAMGVLVHPNFDDEQANGVAVTRNLVSPAWPGFYVNVQVGEDLVTNPEDESVPEEFLIAQLNPDDWSAYEIQYVRYSNRVEEGQTVLTEEQARELAEKLELVRWRFRLLYSHIPDFAAEVEFKITKEGQLVIKQVRPWVD